MNAIGYAFQQLWFGVVRRGWWREIPFLAPESVAIDAFRDTRWRQELAATDGFPIDVVVGVLILSLVGLSFAHLVLINEELRETVVLLFQLLFE